MGKNIGVGIIGFGMAGELFHAPFVQATEGLTLRKISTSNPTRKAKIQEQYPGVTVVESAKDILDDKTIELIIVATSNTSHYELANEALERGKNVVVDKPFVIHSAEADALIRLAHDRDLLLSVYQNRRWDGDFLTLQSLVENGTVGKVVELEINYDRFRPELKADAWREEDLPGSGILYDLGAHILDQALLLFGRPKFILADVAKQRNGSKTIDYFNILLKYASGLRVKLGAGMLVAEPRPHYRLSGDKGGYIKYGFDPQEDALKDGKRPWDLIDWGREEDKYNGTLKYLEDGALTNKIIPTLSGDYRKYYENIYGALTGKASLKVKPEESRNVIRVIEMALESAELGQELEIKYQTENIKY